MRVGAGINAESVPAASRSRNVAACGAAPREDLGTLGRRPRTRFHARGGAVLLAEKAALSVECLSWGRGRSLLFKVSSFNSKRRTVQGYLVQSSKNNLHVFIYLSPSFYKVAGFRRQATGKTK